MKRQYSAPTFEKVVFDYKIQTSGSSSCFGSVINVTEGPVVCKDDPDGNPPSTPVYIGWNDKNPGGI